MTTSNEEQSDFKKFDEVMGGLLAVPYQELHKELEEERKKKARRNQWICQVY